MPFLSLLDDRAKPKGSRDPLGFELIWTHFGRKVVGNLTTITGSVENFTVALLGFYWVHQLHANADNERRERLIRETFLRYEQLVAYLRYQSGSSKIMGITRVQKTLNGPAEELPISLRTQILSDQASYGLWGLYSSALKDSGLIEGSERKPTAKGEALARALCADLDVPSFKALFFENSSLPRGACEELAPKFWEAIKNDEVRKTLTHVLLRGGHGNEAHVQSQLFEAVQELLKRGRIENNFAIDLNEITAIAPVELQQRLNDIHQVERVLVAANNLFHYLLTQDRGSLADVLAKIEDRGYRYDHLPETFPQGGRRQGALSEINDNLRSGNQREAILALVRLNADVMKDRGGAPWLSWENGNKLNVKVKSETARLRCQEELVEKWDYDYFLGSYLQIAKANLEVARG